MSNSYGAATIGGDNGKERLGGVDLWLEGDKIVLSHKQKNLRVPFEPAGGRQALKAKLGDLNFDVTVHGPVSSEGEVKVELKKSLW